MCGITGAFLADPDANANSDLYEALGLLQHRGQDAAGIVTCGARGRLYQCKGNGMVRDVFPAQQLTKLDGSMGVGHGLFRINQFVTRQLEHRLRRKPNHFTSIARMVWYQHIMAT
jgi:glutamine phosphoribosylpyrophosphate amidotransferase